MKHDERGKLPENINEKKEARYPKGSTVHVLANHMDDMKDAKGKVVGAFDTTAYEVSYKDTKTGHIVTHHKWVVKEEFQPQVALQEGLSVVLQTNHMPGMMGATATIKKIVPETVYMIDYKSKEKNRWVQNHQWVIESELEKI